MPDGQFTIYQPPPVFSGDASGDAAAHRLSLLSPHTLQSTVFVQSHVSAPLPTNPVPCSRRRLYNPPT